MLYTTFFDNLQRLSNSITPIAICLKPPDWYNGLEYRKLAPKKSFFSEWRINRDNSYYVRCFYEQVLSAVDAQTVYQELSSMVDTKDIALVCYESPEQFCHRHLVANWFRENNIDIMEYCCYNREQ